MPSTSSIDVIDIKQELPKVAKELGYSEEVLAYSFELLEGVEK